MTIPQILLALSGSPELVLLSKATLLLALALIAVRIAGRAKASVRHLVLFSAFVTLASLPLVMKLAPAFQVDVAVPAAKPLRSAEQVPIAPAVPVPPAAVPASTPEWKLPSWSTIIRLFWALGATLQMAFLGWQLFRLRRIQRSAIPWLEGRELTRTLAIQSGISQPVDVLLHEDIHAPVTCGALRPVVLLPFSVRSWSEDDLRRALIHELEHVRRGDWATQRIARFTAACYWFNPLVWMAWRRLCVEAERAADDAVLRTAPSAEYAEQLLGLARSMRLHDPHPVLGMAKRSDLSARVTAMLDSRQSRGRAGFLPVAGAVAAATLILAGIGPLTAVAQSPAATKSRRATALDKALYEAAETGGVQDIQEILKLGADVNAVIQGDGTPLLGAARKGHLDAVTFLLSRGADPNVPAPGDGSPLIVAAAAGHRDIVSLLLDRGADPNLGVPGDGNPLIMAAGEGRTDMVTLLLSRGARIEDVVPGDENALCKAAEQGQLNAAQLLVSRGANVNARIWVENARGREGEWRSPLIMARRGKHQAVVDFLLASGARD